MRPPIGRNLDGIEIRSAAMLEPEFPASRSTFPSPSTSIAAMPSGYLNAVLPAAPASPEKMLDKRPVGGVSRIGGNFGKENLFRALIPEGELRFAMSRGSRRKPDRGAGWLRPFLYDVPFPGNRRIEVRDKDSPTTKLHCSANRRRRRGRDLHHHRYHKLHRRFDSEEIRLDDDAAPTGAGVTIPDQRRRILRKLRTKSLVSSLSKSATAAPVCSVDGPGIGRSPVEFERCCQRGSAAKAPTARSSAMEQANEFMEKRVK